MINIYDYASPRAAELPKDFINDLLNELTRQHNELITARIMVSKIKNPKHKIQREAYLNKQELKLQGAIDLLDAVGLHAAYNWAGENNRDRYIFPSSLNCAMQEDWLFQCEE